MSQNTVEVTLYDVFNSYLQPISVQYFSWNLNGHQVMSSM